MTKQYRKQFFPTYLIVKTHRVTGLKYFCKTTCDDPHRYSGSGIYWIRHLKDHGRLWDTEIIGYFVNEEECRQAALTFSQENNIVNAVDQYGKKIWANMIAENGTDGGKTYSGARPKEVGEKISNSLSAYWANASSEIREQASVRGKLNGALSRKRKKGEYSPSIETREKNRVASTGRKQSHETIEKRANKLRKPRSEEAKQNIRAGNKLYWEKVSTMPIETQAVLAQERSRRAKQAKIDHPVTNETANKIKTARANQKNVVTWGMQNKGKVIAVNKQGELSRIDKDQYYSQSGPKEDWEWVSHKAKEAKMRRG